MQKKGIPAASGTKKRGEKIFCYLGFGGPPPSTLAYPISDRLLINFLSLMMIIPFMPKTKTHA